MYQNTPTENSINKKVVNELMNPDQLYLEAKKKGGLKRPKNDIIARNESKLLTNDGREVLNENI
jgi:hypothetical protein